MRTVKMVRPRRHTRPLALALTLLWALGPLLSVVHSDDHVHRFCLEHGTFEEAKDPEPAVASEAHAHARVYSLAEAEHDHRACPLPQPGPRNVLVGPMARLVAQAVVSAEDSRLVESSGHPPILHLRLAPKSSPPLRPTV
jgi:hypothetical protein